MQSCMHLQVLVYPQIAPPAHVKEGWNNYGRELTQESITCGTHKVNLECEERVESRVQITCTVFMMVIIRNNN